jgi:hypothetical protein
MKIGKFRGFFTNLMIFEFLKKMRNRQILKNVKNRDFLRQNAGFVIFFEICKILKNAQKKSLTLYPCQSVPEFPLQKSCKNVKFLAKFSVFFRENEP